MLPTLGPSWDLRRYAVAAFVRHDGQKYTDGAAIRAAPSGVIFWLHTFNLGVYPGAILPFLIGYLADASTAVGDLTATEEASFLETHGVQHDQRIQGCLLADGGAFARDMPADLQLQASQLGPETEGPGGLTP